MKILVVGSFAESLVQFRGPLLEALVNLGIEVHVAAPGLDENSSFYDHLLAMHVTPHRIFMQRAGVNPAKDIFSLFSLFFLISKLRPDVVLGYTIKPVIYGSIAAAISSVPARFALITGLGYSFTDDAKGGRKFLRFLVRFMYKIALLQVHKVFFQNADDEALFASLNILSSSTPSVVVNGSGVDIDKFSVVDLPENSIRFLLIARLLGDKGVREYAAAAAVIKSRYPSVECQLVGWIDENPDAISPAELNEWIDSGCINYFGKLSDVRPAIAGCSVYVLPSYREGTPRTVLEAMAMGRAVITTDAPGCRETVVHGRNGLLVPVRDAEALIAAMEEFIRSPQLIQEMGVRSRILAEDKYDVRKINLHMMNEMGVI